MCKMQHVDRLPVCDKAQSCSCDCFSQMLYLHCLQVGYAIIDLCKKQLN